MGVDAYIDQKSTKFYEFWKGETYGTRYLYYR